ncbi:MAG: DUF3617 family protein [Hydrocarboniphaga effusa]|nr:DUF3617 family protein [Hydrocarboniphaga effusa]
MKNWQAVAMALAAGLPLSAHAEKPAMKPGLWEYTMKMEMPGMPFAMPPIKTERCLKQDEIDRGDQYSKDEKNDCQIKNLKQGASSASYDVSCKDGTTGHYDFTYGGDSMKGKGVTDSQGHQMTTNFTSKRLGECK